VVSGSNRTIDGGRGNGRDPSKLRGSGDHLNNRGKRSMNYAGSVVARDSFG